MEKTTVVTCDKCGTTFDPVTRRARKGELRAEYLQCPACYTVYPIIITDAPLRRLIRDSSPEGFRGYKKDRMHKLKAKHVESLKQLDGWTEERE